MPFLVCTFYLLHISSLITYGPTRFFYAIEFSAEWKLVGANHSPENLKGKNKPENPLENGGGTHSDRPPSSRPHNSARIIPALEQEHQQELDRLRNQHARERQRIVEKHQQDQQKLQQRVSDSRKGQEIQSKQQQQLQQLDGKHGQQQQKLQQKQQLERQKQQKQVKPQSPSKPSQNDKQPSHN